MQCILGTPHALTMAVGALNVVLLFSLVTGLSGLPRIIPLSDKEGENHALPTELQPPPLDNNEQATVFIINLYAVKNSSSNEPAEMFKNEIIETVPDLLEPLATVLLVVESNEDEKQRLPADLDEFAEGLKVQGYKVDKIDYNGKTKVLKMKLEKAEAQSMVEAASKPDDKTKPRQKRAICYKCGGRGGGGHGGGRRGGWGKGGGGGGGCRTCGGGRGGSWSSSSSSAHSSSSSGSWGK